MNRLSQETSPYLLQHKDNPVDWFAWKDEAWQKAKSENKLVLVSIGYSACHWCHVMEHEVFEDFESAEIMNRHFVCIKVDREERPDVDQVYMDAVHLMGSQGGWPLNVFTLPDGRPIFGGTYFPKKTWINILENLIDLFKSEPEKVLNYAAQLQEGLDQLNDLALQTEAQKRDVSFIHDKVEHWSKYWDQLRGGARKAPKFPMPNNWEFLLDYAVLNGNNNVLDFVHLTLEKMALGGIYDQIGGGFARYSVDDLWKVPHFEKMLYDNAQLISLYAKAYRQSHHELYRDVLIQTAGWLEREMLAESGCYFAALDADSEGVEGKFYTWTEAELKEVLTEDFEWAAHFYRIGKEAYWEHDQQILLRNENNEDFARRHQLKPDELNAMIQRIHEKLLRRRASRVRPGLDNKCIASWNGLMLKAWCEVHKALPGRGYDQKALRLAQSMESCFIREDYAMWHVHTNGKSAIHGFLDDYVFAAEGYFSLFEITGEEAHAKLALELIQKAIALFDDADGGLCFFTSSQSEKLITRRKEIQDNVIPSANSALARLLKKLAVVFDLNQLRDKATRMDQQVGPIIDFASGYSNWLQSLMNDVEPQYEVVIGGKDALEEFNSWNKTYIPHTLCLPLTKESSLPVFKGRFSQGTVFYVCTQSHCLPPVNTIDAALKLIQRN